MRRGWSRHVRALEDEKRALEFYHDCAGSVKACRLDRNQAHLWARLGLTLAEHFALRVQRVAHENGRRHAHLVPAQVDAVLDRKSTRLNSSHRCISYAVFCLKKKKK